MAQIPPPPKETFYPNIIRVKTFSEIWSIFVAEGEGSVYTARDNDVIIADLTCKVLFGFSPK